MLFGGERKQNGRPAVTIDTLIGTGTIIEGDIRFRGGLHIDGTVRGKVVAEPGSAAVLTLSDQGTIEGEVTAPHVVINGMLRGDVYACERIEMASKARVTGNIHYKLLEMAAGAQVNGQIVREEEPRPESAASALPAPAEA